MVPKTIKKRAVTIYLSSEGQKERWESLSKQSAISFSKFVTENVENSLRQLEDANYKSRSELWKESNQLKQQVQDLSKQCKLLDTVVDKLEQELRRYRSKTFLEENFEGVRSYEKDLVDLLKSKEIISDDEILSRLNISPSESDAVRAIGKQLESLQFCGLVSSCSRGWKWKR